LRPNNSIWNFFYLCAYNIAPLHACVKKHSNGKVLLKTKTPKHNATKNLSRDLFCPISTGKKIEQIYVMLHSPSPLYSNFVG